MNTTQFYVESELRVVGQDPECADYTNPSGNIHADVFIVCVDLNDGEIYRHSKAWETEEEAVKFLSKVRAAISTGYKLNMDHWTYNRMAYGSKAYQERGGEQELMQFERDCYGDHW